ncbi:MAG: rod shape-determining protein MreC [bacterium]|nr:rod shape-determining protein MreC [bacterium]
MKMNYHRNKKRGGKRAVFAVAAAALFLVLMIFNDSAARLVSVPVMGAARPFLKMSNSVGEWFGGNIAIMKEKKALEEENRGLKEEVSTTAAKLLSYGIIKKENEELKAILSRAGEEKRIAAAILSRPPRSPYDTLILDAGSKDGVEKGMEAAAYGDILVGYVSEVFPSTSKVRMISFPGEETTVALGESGVAVAASGRGGGNLEIILPRAVEVKIGERVATLGVNSLVIGIVEKIQVNPADPFQKILFRLPLNLQELKYITLTPK